MKSIKQLSVSSESKYVLMLKQWPGCKTRQFFWIGVQLKMKASEDAIHHITHTTSITLLAVRKSGSHKNTLRYNIKMLIFAAVIVQSVSIPDA